MYETLLETVPMLRALTVSRKFNRTAQCKMEVIDTTVHSIRRNGRILKRTRHLVNRVDSAK
jgi:tetrahydromethanopterin S-methyltransferase subunit F